MKTIKSRIESTVKLETPVKFHGWDDVFTHSYWATLHSKLASVMCVAFSDVDDNTGESVEVIQLSIVRHNSYDDALSYKEEIQHYDCGADLSMFIPRIDDLNFRQLKYYIDDSSLWKTDLVECNAVLHPHVWH